MRICFLLHQGSMYSGGQGVYLAALSAEYVERGHEVHAIVGPPYPDLHPGSSSIARGLVHARLMETGDASSPARTVLRP
jgi:hypothetical protein